MGGRLSRRARARQMLRIQAQIDCAVRNFDSPDENVRAEAGRRLCPCRTHVNWTLDRFVIPMLHDTSPIVRSVANFVLTEELENEMVRDARAVRQPGRVPHFVWRGTPVFRRPLTIASLAM